MNVLTLIAVCIVVTIPMVIGVWLGLRLTGRKFSLKRRQAPLPRLLLVALIVTAAVLVGSWIGNRGDWSDPAGIYATVAAWLIALAATFYTAKRT